MYTISKTTALATLGTAVAMLAAGCGDTSTTSQDPLQTQPIEMKVFIKNSIQIDQLGDDPMSPQDANLFAGLDPADQTVSVNKPADGPGDFIDWEDLAGDLDNHRLLDAYTSKDPSAFPQSNECVGPAQVLSKMDLTYYAVASNTKYAYVALQRADNNGDAAYYAIFTKKQPIMVTGQAPCSANQQRLLYDITKGDVLLAGHFHPSADQPLMQAYKATGDFSGVPATMAVNYTSGIWAEQSGGVAAVAVNTTNTAPGAFGAYGVKALDSKGNLLPEIFTEAALPIDVFTGGGQVCGAQFYGTVITRSSSSGATNPDLKDLAGPVLYNFGKATAEAKLTPSCKQEFGYELTTFTGPDGSAVANPACEWTFDNGTTASGCNGTMQAGTGTHSATLTVTDPDSSCSDTVDVSPVQVYASLSANVTLTSACNLTFGYDVSPMDGSGSYAYDWTFSGGGTMTPSSSTSKNGNVTVGTGNVAYGASVVVTDLRTDIVCSTTVQDTVTPYAPLAVSLHRQEQAPVCPMSSDAVTYDAVASGGTGSYTYAWNGIECAGASCTIDPPNDVFCYTRQFSVTVNDPKCGSAGSETESYSKQTTITASDN